MRAFVGVGSNLGSHAGDPRDTVLRAADELGGLAERAGVGPLRRSSVYRTEPVGLREQPDFANLVVEIGIGAGSSLGPEGLLDLCLQVERRFGRERGEPNAPRTLDLDLLLVGDLILRSARLELPHPRMHQRRFVLVPLAELAPTLRHPRCGRTVAELLAGCTDGSRVEPWPASVAVGGAVR